MLNDPRALRDNRDRSGGRDRYRGRGSIVNYYEDLGLATTEESYNEWKEQDNLYQSSMAQAAQDLQTAKESYSREKGRYDKALRSLPDLNTALEKSWEEYKRGLTKVVVTGKEGITNPNSSAIADYYATHPGATTMPQSEVDKAGLNNWESDKGIKGTFYLPRDVVDKYRLSRGIFAVDRGPNEVHITGKDDHYLKVYKALKQGEEQLKNKYIQTATPQLANELAQGNAQLSEAKGALDAAQAQIVSREEYLKETDAQRQAEMQAIRDRYKNRLSTLKEIYGGMTIGT